MTSADLMYNFNDKIISTKSSFESFHVLSRNSVLICKRQIFFKAATNQPPSAATHIMQAQMNNRRF